MTIEINIENDRQALALAYFVKRMTFDMAYDASHGGTHEEIKSMAYEIIGGILAVQKGLAEAGFAPR
jgi:hypothetical protein